MPPTNPRYFNAFPHQYPDEREAARAAGVAGVPCPSIGFEILAGAGERLIFVITENGDLMVAPKLIRGFEVRHPVLAEGGPVLAAGELELAIAPGVKLVFELTNRSGHYSPPSDCLVLVEALLRSLGFDILDGAVQPYPGLQR